MTRTPIGVTQWKNEGKKFGYWDYFKREVLDEVIKLMPDETSGVDKDAPLDKDFIAGKQAGWNECRKQMINKLTKISI